MMSTARASIPGWNGAQEAEGLFARILELVLFVRGNVDYIARADFEDLPSHQQPGGAPEDVDAVIVVVAVEGGLAAGRDFIVPHAEVDGAVAFANDDLLGTAHGPAFVVRLDVNAFPRVAIFRAGKTV